MSVIDSTEVEVPNSSGGRLRMAVGLLENRHRLMLLLLTLGRIAVGFCDLLVAAAMYLLFLLLQGRSPGHHFWWIPKSTLAAAVITSVLVVLRCLMDLVSARAVYDQVQNIYSSFLLRLTGGYSQIQWSRFIEFNRSELSHHALHTAREASDFYHRCVALASSIVIIAVMTGALVYQSRIAAGGLCFALAVFYGMHRFVIRRKLHVAASSREMSLRGLQRNLADMFSSGKEIRTYRNQAFFQERIRRQAERVGISNLHVVFIPHFARIVADQGALLVFLSIVIGVQLRERDVSQLLSLLVFYFVLSRRLIPLISQISFIAGQMDGSYENVKIVNSELNRCRKHRTLSLPTRLPDAGMVMQMMQVSYSFQDGPSLLRNVNLCMRKGETIVIHGASGIGKSSLLNLIAGVSQPLSGVIRVDRASVAYVPQEITLLDDSIRNNLLFGLQKQSDEKLMKALAEAKLDEFVAALPLGLDTGVGDNGALFSGGERQRLGLARAILRGCPLLLLDEATSALDEENELQVLENLSTSGMAIVLVTHRVHTRTFGHRVFRLEDGSLKEEISQDAPINEQILFAVASD